MPAIHPAAKLYYSRKSGPVLTVAQLFILNLYDHVRSLPLTNWNVMSADYSFVLATLPSRTVSMDQHVVG